MKRLYALWGIITIIGTIHGMNGPISDQTREEIESNHRVIYKALKEQALLLQGVIDLHTQTVQYYDNATLLFLSDLEGYKYNIACSSYCSNLMVSRMRLLEENNIKKNQAACQILLQLNKCTQWPVFIIPNNSHSNKMPPNGMKNKLLE